MLYKALALLYYGFMMMTKTNKGLLRGVVLILVAVTLNACGGSTPDSSPTAQPAPLPMAHSLLEPVVTNYSPDDTTVSVPNHPEELYSYRVDCVSASDDLNDLCQLMRTESADWTSVSGLPVFDDGSSHKVIFDTSLDNPKNCAVTGHDDAGDCYINFNVIEPACNIDVWGVETVKHELGHCLGLGHSNDVQSIMYYALVANKGITTANVEWISNNWKE